MTTKILWEYTKNLIAIVAMAILTFMLFTYILMFFMETDRIAKVEAIAWIAFISNMIHTIGHKK